MAKIETIEHYEAAVLGFSDVLALPDREARNAERAAYQDVARATGDTRIYHAYRAFETDTADLSKTAEQVASVLYTATVIDDWDPTDPAVVGVLNKRRELYDQAAADGFDEMHKASDFARNLGSYFVDKTGIITSAPRHEVQPFISRYALGKWFPPEHLVCGEDLPEPTTETYQMMAERLGVSSLNKLLVVDSVTANLVAAKAAGATVIGLMSNKSVKELNRIQLSDSHLDGVVANSSILQDTLQLPAARPAPILEYSQPVLQPAQ